MMTQLAFCRGGARKATTSPLRRGLDRRFGHVCSAQRVVRTADPATSAIVVDTAVRTVPPARFHDTRKDQLSFYSDHLAGRLDHEASLITDITGGLSWTSATMDQRRKNTGIPSM
jgi:hypothetical protein